MSGQSFPQDVVAGTQLVTPSIHSPNYLTGVSGWTINLDGSAEFNNLTIRGTFSGTDFILNSSGFFLYSGTPGSGNLVASIAAASVSSDTFGNTVQGGGFASYSSGSYGALSQAFLSLFSSGANTPGLVNMQAPGWIVMQSGNAAGGDTEASVSAQSRDANSGTSLIALTADDVQMSTVTVTTTLTVAGTDVGSTLSAIISALSGQVTSTNGLTDGTIAGTSSNAGLTNGQITGTSGSASAGTAHTHGGGSYAVTNGQHSHSSGSYAVNNGQHDHTLPTVP